MSVPVTRLKKDRPGEAAGKQKDDPSHCAFSVLSVSTAPGSKLMRLLADPVQPFPAEGELPGEIYGHSAVLWRAAMFVFGGCTQKAAFSADLFKFSFSTRSSSTFRSRFVVSKLCLP